MNGLALLEKFETVEITNESRISGEELEFCTAQQALYEKVLAQHRKTFAALRQVESDCMSFLKSVADLNDYQNGSYTYKHYGFDYVGLKKEDFVEEKIKTVHRQFISTIIDYFKEKYNVSIESPAFKTVSGLQKPEKEDHSFGWYRDLSEAEKEKIASQKRAYEALYDAYLDSVISAELDYNSMLDHIFVELDGNTFAERAEQEIKKGSCNATQRWGKTAYEVKNKRISMDILYPRKGYRDEYDVDLSGGDYRAILRALTYFNSDKNHVETYSGWQQFIGYSNYESSGIFDLHQVGSTKVLTFKYYKNGKFEVTFDSHATAQQFADEYLYQAEVNANE